jgi:preprotein translocase subunit SecG
MSFFLYTIHVLTCLFLILVVLLQQGKGADLSVFGGGGTMTAFGARGAASLLHKMTVGGFVLFIVTTLAIGAFQKQGQSVVGDVPAVEETAAAETEDGAAESAPATGALPEAEEPTLTNPEPETFDEEAASDLPAVGDEEVEESGN